MVVDMVVHAPPGEPQQAPLIMVSGRALSPGVYWALRLLGKTLDVALERGFVHSLTFKILSLITKSISSTSPLPVERRPEMLQQHLLLKAY
jgi:hypothetical protein